MNTEIRRNIQKTAAKLFLKYGLRSVSIDDICNELHISKKTFYSYFSQKEELIESVLLEHDDKKFDKQMGRAKKCLTNGNMIDNILAFSSYHLINSNNQFVNFFFDLSKYYPEIHKKQIQRNHDKFYENMVKNINRGIEEGIFRNDLDIDLMARFLSVQLLTVMNMLQMDKSKVKPQNTFEFLTDIFIRLLCNKKGLEYYDAVRGKENSETEKISQRQIGDDEIELLIDSYLNTADNIIQSTLTNINR